MSCFALITICCFKVGPTNSWGELNVQHIQSIISKSVSGRRSGVFCRFWVLKLVQGWGTVAHRPITLQDFFSAPVKVHKSLLHYWQTVGLVEYKSISLTAAKGLNGTDLMVRHTLSVFWHLPLLTRQTVIALGAVTRHTVWVTLLTVIGVFVTIETIRTRWNTTPLWEK